VKELSGTTQALPQLQRLRVGVARLRSAIAFDDLEHRRQATTKFEFLSLAIGVVWQQRQLIQPFLKLRGRLHHCKAGGGPLSRLTPIGDGFFNEPGLGVMLCEELGLAFCNLGGVGFERICDPHMQLPAGIAQ